MKIKINKKALLEENDLATALGYLKKGDALMEKSSNRFTQGNFNDKDIYNYINGHIHQEKGNFHLISGLGEKPDKYSIESNNRINALAQHLEKHKGNTDKLIDIFHRVNHDVVNNDTNEDQHSIHNWLKYK